MVPPMVVHEQELLAPGLAFIGEWPSLAEANEHALVVLAMHLDCMVMPAGGNFALFSEPESAARILNEFDHYAAEQKGSGKTANLRVFPAGIGTLLPWITALLIVFIMQGRDPGFTDRFCNSSQGLMEAGEWWRPFTALFLHADAGHLLGNIAIGGIFCVLVAQSVGSGRAWLLILASGTAGNATTAWLRFPDAYQSIGASTATFGALGILVGLGVRMAWKSRSDRVFRPLLMPVVAGLILLGWFGAGGENTDVAAHFAGSAWGTVLGLFVAADYTETSESLPG